MSKCNNDCKFYKYFGDNKVKCQHYNEVFVIPEVCAAKVLTKNGWENASIEASKKGEIERAFLFKQRASQYID